MLYQCYRIPELKNVLFKDDLKANLINISQLCNDKCLSKFNLKECTMYDSPRIFVVKGIKSECKCYCVSESFSLMCNITSLSVEELWNKKLGHVNYNLLKRISSLKTAKGFPLITTQFHHICCPC